MKKFDYQKVEAAIGYHFTNGKLLKQAFFRSSFAHENGRESNEVLEFIGDKVLDLAVMRILLEKYGKSNNGEEYFKSNKQEGELTKIKSELVSTGYLAGSFDALSVEEFIYYGKSDLNNKVTDVMSIKEDVFEAIIGAIALDSNWNMDKIIKIVKKLLHTDKFLKQTDVDTNFVGVLQETTVALGLEAPKYTLTQVKVGEELMWEANVKIKGIKEITSGYGYKQKDAKKEAASKMIPLVKKTTSNKKETDIFAIINSLIQAKIISKPFYDYVEDYDENGNPIWVCWAHLNELGYKYPGHGSSKKEAQKNALTYAYQDIEKELVK